MTNRPRLAVVSSVGLAACVVAAGAWWVSTGIPTPTETSDAKIGAGADVALPLGTLVVCDATGAPHAIDAPFVRQVRIVEPGSIASPILGFAYVPTDRIFAIMQSTAHGTALAKATLFGDAAGVLPINITAAAPGSIAYDAVDSTLMMVDQRAKELIRVTLQPRRAGTALPVDRLRLQASDTARITGIAVDPASRSLLLLDAAVPQIIRLPAPTWGAERTGSGSAPCALSLPGVGRGDLEGLAVRPADGHLFTFAKGSGNVLELDPGGAFIAGRNVAAMGVHEASGLAFAPSGDPTDDPKVENLYLADGSGDLPPRFFELALEKAALPQSDHAYHAVVVRTIHTSRWSPPSSDPDGLAYDEERKQMIVTDSEVDEMPFYAGANVFGFSGDGVLTSRSVTHFSNEPSDVAIDSAGGRRFYADDTVRKIFQVEGGPDGNFGTDDDIVSGFDTTLFHSDHPEGLSYGQDSLFVADGPGAEIFRITPGPNGEFDGSAPLGDDVVSSFDTAAVGVRDPEAVAYAKETGTLLVVDHAEPLRIVEMTTAGDLVRVIDVSDLPVVAPAAVELGPASDGSGDPRVYVADRGVDNAQSATENDGRIYELRVEPGPAPVLANGGFEFDGDLDQRPDGWILGADAIGISETVHSGKRALSLAVTTDGQTVARQGGRAVEGGTAYLVRGWTRSISAADMHVEFRLTWREMDGTVIRSDKLLTTARPGSTWAESVAPVTSPSKAVGVQLSIGLGPAGATAVIDDISLEPVVGN